ncbi:N-acetyltransferase GCN5 [Gandjariella thermophila]|uniref:N-acetyltransferase GCN5 n=2 Tax=Gandjariella thermophila TaxID=1931992 RepID=A0A4D4J5V9_9PSEU|nr:N-acetyltransferase GCN5 [Gandjariella thermophila]
MAAPHHPVELTGEHVFLREFRHDDVADCMPVFGDERVTRWLSFDSKTRAEQEELVAGIIRRAQTDPRDEYYLTVCRRDDKQLIGVVRLALTGVCAGRLGGAIRADHWGRGLAMDAAATIVHFGFGELGLHRISAAVGPDNLASRRLVCRLGMSYEGRIRHHVFTGGAWRDSLLYALLADEWPARRLP